MLELIILSFRSPEDMQYSFAYYYYLMNRYKAKYVLYMMYYSNVVSNV